MKVVAIIQARMGSTRLPGKVLLPIAGIPAIEHVIHRVCWAATSLHAIVVAIPDTAENDELAVQIQQYAPLGVSCYRGPENDVLARYAHAAATYNADLVVRITADCPFIRPDIIQEGVRRAQAYPERYGYFCWESRNNFDAPHGTDIQIFTYRYLMLAHMQATSAEEREHVIPFMLHHATEQRHQKVRGGIAPEDCTKQQLRMVLDTPGDYEWFQQIAAEVSCTPPLPTPLQLDELLETKPWLARYD